MTSKMSLRIISIYSSLGNQILNYIYITGYRWMSTHAIVASGLRVLVPLR